jgi:Cdc6-like AAA superfamily ATPase
LLRGDGTVVLRKPGDVANKWNARVPSVVFVLSLGLIAVLLLWPQDSLNSAAEPVVDESIETDEPIGDVRHDRYGFAEIATSLAYFLRSQSTQGPLTIAVSGPWGSGKSSILRMVEAELRRHGARPVWFNAWHNKSPDAIIPSMIEHVVRRAPPPAWTYDGIALRRRLLEIRLREALDEQPGASFALAFTLGVVWGGVAAHPEVGERVLDWVLPEEFHGVSGLALGVLSAWQVYTQGGAWVRALGMVPDQLVAQVRDLGSVGAIAQRAVVSNDFAVEFRRLCDALGNDQRIVLFVDDIDRCSPEAVEKVLEGMNFLVNAGACFIVVGMAREFVEKSMALRIRPEVGVDARHYLEKLVNLEVQVPRVDPSQPVISGVDRTLLSTVSQ